MQGKNASEHINLFKSLIEIVFAQLYLLQRIA